MTLAAAITELRASGLSAQDIADAGGPSVYHQTKIERGSKRAEAYGAEFMALGVLLASRRAALEAEAQFGSVLRSSGFTEREIQAHTHRALDHGIELLPESYRPDTCESGGSAGEATDSVSPAPASAVVVHGEGQPVEALLLQNGKVQDWGRLTSPLECMCDRPPKPPELEGALGDLIGKVSTPNAAPSATGKRIAWVLIVAALLLGAWIRRDDLVALAPHWVFAR